MTGRSMESSQVARFLRDDDTVGNDCDLVLYSILDRQPV